MSKWSPPSQSYTNAPQYNFRYVPGYSSPLAHPSLANSYPNIPVYSPVVPVPQPVPQPVPVPVPAPAGALVPYTGAPVPSGPTAGEMIVQRQAGAMLNSASRKTNSGIYSMGYMGGATGVVGPSGFGGYGQTGYGGFGPTGSFGNNAVYHYPTGDSYHGFAGHAAYVPPQSYAPYFGNGGIAPTYSGAGASAFAPTYYGAGASAFAPTVVGGGFGGGFAPTVVGY